MTWSAAPPLSMSVRVYAASLAKQVVGACAALLVRSGRLDPDAAVTGLLPELPRWAAGIRLAHLVHHTAGLPDDVDVDARCGPVRDRTTRAVVAALAGMPAPRRPPGTAFAYSNAGYVCLALAVERTAAAPLPVFAEERLFRPLGMRDTVFWPGPDPAPPASLPLSPPRPAPLSLGDGGMWSTAHDLLRWGRAMNDDILGISALVQTPGRLDDGGSVDYGWGVGIRSHAGHDVFRHGGGWHGLRLLHARVPGREASLLLVALRDDTERRVVLADALLDRVCEPGPTVRR